MESPTVQMEGKDRNKKYSCADILQYRCNLMWLCCKKVIDIRNINIDDMYHIISILKNQHLVNTL